MALHPLIEKAAGDGWTIAELIDVAETVGLTLTMEKLDTPVIDAAVLDNAEELLRARPEPSRARRHWLKGEVETVRLWWNAGQTTEEIAAKMGRSTEAVRKKIAEFKNEK